MVPFLQCRKLRFGEATRLEGLTSALPGSSCCGRDPRGGPPALGRLGSEHSPHLCSTTARRGSAGLCLSHPQGLGRGSTAPPPPKPRHPHPSVGRVCTQGARNLFFPLNRNKPWSDLDSARAHDIMRREPGQNYVKSLGSNSSSSSQKERKRDSAHPDQVCPRACLVLSITRPLSHDLRPQGPQMKPSGARNLISVRIHSHVCPRPGGGWGGHYLPPPQPGIPSSSLCHSCPPAVSQPIGQRDPVKVENELCPLSAKASQGSPTHSNARFFTGTLKGHSIWPLLPAPTSHPHSQPTGHTPPWCFSSNTPSTHPPQGLCTSPLPGAGFAQSFP